MDWSLSRKNRPREGDAGTEHGYPPRDPGSFFLDCIDHHFVKLYKKSGGKIAVFNCKLEQAFSGDDHSDWEKDYCRFLIYKKDFYLFCRDSFTGKIYYFLKIVMRALRLSLIYKNIAFIKGVFRTCPK
jgi:rhamnosyltransferase